MLVCVSNMLRTAASALKKDLPKADEGKKTVVFLGGVCSDDNSWREDLKKEFSDDYLLLDPYDKDWDPSDNIYDEIKGMMKSDYVLFYKGGKGSEKEKDFMDNLKGEGNFEEFDDLEKLKDFLRKMSKPHPVKKEAKIGQSYDNASTQVDLPDDLAKKILDWGHNNVADEDLYTKPDGGMGRENEIHVTLLYGLKNDDPDEIAELIKGTGSFDVRLGLVTAFRDGDDNDVLKIDAEAPELQKLHYLIDEETDNDNSYPTYQPHVTIAYMKKGKADPYIGDDTFRGKKFKAEDITFSTKDNKKIQIPLK